jgi:hypothetical protein
VGDATLCVVVDEQQTLHLKDRGDLGFKDRHLPRIIKEYLNMFEFRSGGKSPIGLLL